LGHARNGREDPNRSELLAERNHMERELS